ncbi:MAG: type II toxin-antitoxin system VapC family toxin [Dehalococcoidia bacterium]
MILVDTSVWVSHLRIGDEHLKHLLIDGEVATHPFVIGELACGNLRNRQETLTLLQFLPQSKQASQEEALQFIESHALMGIGIGFIDIHLLASARLSQIPIWTLDKNLDAAALALSISYKPAGAS